MRHLARAAALALLAVAPLAAADIVLEGFFHTGDDDGRPEFTPDDPVDCIKYRSNPTRFHLTQAATITAFTLDDAVDLEDTDITIDLDGTQRSAIACGSCLTDGTVTITLTTGISLAAGDHTIAVIDPSGGSCEGGNDFGWSGLTLSSTETTDSVMLVQRRNIGDDNDSDDDYDIADAGNPWYPDTSDGTSASLSFTLGANRRLSEVKLYRLRDLDVSAASVLVDGSSIGNLANTGDPLENSPTTVSTNLLLLAGTHTLTVQSANIVVGNLDTFSWDDIILRFAATTTTGTAGFFNAVDVGGNAVSGSITTQLAGGAFALDLYALNGFGTGQDTGHSGSASVEVLNASNNSGTVDLYGCSSSWTVAQTLSSVTFVGGYVQVSGTFLDAGLKQARIRVTDSTTGARGCSIDNFAIRPASLGVAPSQGSETTAGLATALTNAATSGLPRHRAGQPFTIVATGKAVGGATASNYDGSPTAATPVVIAPATVAGTVSLGNWGAASGGARRTDTATYAEVGAVTINLEDTAWAAVDADDSTAVQRTITGSVNAGRFVPDHFKVTDGTLAPACVTGGFSYLGTALAWSSAAVTLTAENAGNTTTLNYEGVLETLPDTLAQPGYAVYDDAAIAGTPALNTGGLAAPTISAATDGVATLALPSLSFVRSLVGAFAAEIAITLPAFDDDDDIVPAESPIVIGSAAAGSGVAFTASAKAQRFGRLYFEPRYGSELMPLDVPLRAEYFDGVTFVPNIADSCTVLAASDITLVPAVAGQSKILTALGGGRWTVQLGAPLDDGQATLSIDLASPPVSPAVPYPLLTADTDANGTYAEDPTTTVTFGLHTQDDKRIYSREVVGSN